MNVPSSKAPWPEDEADRLRAIERYRLGGIGREPAFDHLTQLAAALFSVPISLVTVVSADVQCFRGACGLTSTGTPREVAFCSFAILSDEVMVVSDACRDPRFRDNPLVTGEPHIRFYAGVPLRVTGGQALGTLCLIDREPRDFGPEDRERLRQLARTAVDLIEMRVERFAADEQRQKVAAERELLELTVENVSEGVVLVDGDLRLILWNHAFVELFDYPPESVAEGADAAALMRLTAERGDLGPGDPGQIVAAFVSSIRSASSRQIEIRRTDGTVLEIRRKSIAGGRFIMTARDVTQERQIAQLKDELVSTVSHELRTPLTAISGALGLLGAGAAGALPPKAQNLVQIGRKNAERLITLVNDLLDMDKLQSGSLEFRFAETDLRSLLKEVAEQCELLSERFGVRLSLELPDRPLLAWVDEARINQVITNLISNACKFSPSGSQVRIELTRDEEYAQISVVDQGPGISDAFRERLFSRFAQEGEWQRKGLPGTGLGLAISKSIVDAHAGTITLDADVAAGATFHVRLPLDGRPKGAGQGNSNSSDQAHMAQ